VGGTSAEVRVTIQHVAKGIQAWNQLQKINYPHLESGLAKPMHKRCTFKCTPIVSRSYHLANHGYWPEHSVLEKCKLKANTTKQHNSHAGAIWGRGSRGVSWPWSRTVTMMNMKDFLWMLFMIPKFTSYIR
jgi:hypothetical protein